MLDKNPDRVTFRHLLSPQIHELPTSVSHVDITAMLQEAIYRHFRPLPLSVIVMCFANIGSGGYHGTSLLGEAAGNEKNFRLEFGSVPQMFCSAFCLLLPLSLVLALGSASRSGLNFRFGRRSDSNWL